MPAIWIDGGIHAREWISPAAVTYVIDYLVENSDSLEADYYILPVANPDGYVLNDEGQCRYSLSAQIKLTPTSCGT